MEATTRNASAKQFLRELKAYQLRQNGPRSLFILGHHTRRDGVKVPTGIPMTEVQRRWMRAGYRLARSDGHPRDRAKQNYQAHAPSFGLWKVGR